MSGCNINIGLSLPLWDIHKVIKWIFSACAVSSALFFFHKGRKSKLNDSIVNRAGYHECLTFPCRVQMGEDGCTADEPVKHIHVFGFSAEI